MAKYHLCGSSALSRLSLFLHTIWFNWRLIAAVSESKIANVIAHLEQEKLLFEGIGSRKV